VRNDHVRLQVDQFSCELLDPLRSAGGPTNVEPHVAAVYPTQLMKPLREARNPKRSLRIVFAERHEHTDAPKTVRLLRARHERP
jgi:hypothetical protein